VTLLGDLATRVTAGARAELVLDARRRRLLGQELLLVLAVSLARSGLFALIDLIGALASPAPLSAQSTQPLNGSAYSASLVDLAYQLAVSAVRLVPVLLVAYLLSRDGERLRDLGVDQREPGRDLVRGAAVAAVVGGTGLALYLGAHAIGANLTVIPTSLPPTWWRTPVLILSAATNAVLEEVVVVGYLLRRLDQRGWSDGGATAVSALVRGSYHLYQGFGGFVGNAVMGVLFVRLARRWGRVVPLIVAHTLIDSVAFVGYAALVGRVSWLPH